MSDPNKSEDIHIKSLEKEARSVEDEDRDLAVAIGLSLEGDTSLKGDYVQKHKIGLPLTRPSGKEEKKITVPPGMPPIPGITGILPSVSSGSVPIGAHRPLERVPFMDPHWDKDESEPDHNEILLIGLEKLLDKYMDRSEAFWTKMMEKHFPVKD